MKRAKGLARRPTRSVSLGAVGLGFGGVWQRTVRFVTRSIEAARESAGGSSDVRAGRDIAVEEFWCS